MNDHIHNPTSGQGFVKLQRSETTKALLGDTNALHLLTVIAYRARWSDGESLDGLSFGQALVGDHAEIGMTSKAYRCAKQRLEKWQLATFRGTRQGSIATLADGRVFVLRDERGRSQRGQRKGQEQGQQLSEEKTPNGANDRANPKENEGRTKGEQGASNQNESMPEGQNVQGASAGTDASEVERMLTELASDPANAGLDVRREYERMALWCRTNHKQPTRRRFVAWLLRADRPLNATRSAGAGQLSPEFRKF